MRRRSLLQVVATVVAAPTARGQTAVPRLGVLFGSASPYFPDFLRDSSRQRGWPRSAYVLRIHPARGRGHTSRTSATNDAAVPKSIVCLIAIA